MAYKLEAEEPDGPEVELGNLLGDDNISARDESLSEWDGSIPV